MKQRFVFVFLVFVILGTSGCATSALLTSGPKQYRPANPPNMAALQRKDGKRVLIVYDEQSDAYRKPVRRAYWIDPQAEPPARVEKPIFVQPREGKGLKPVAISEQPAPTGLSLVPEVQDASSFTLYDDGEKLWRQSLPVYERPRFTLKQSALLPLAVAADATVVGGIAAVAVAYWYAGGTGFPDIPLSSETK
jgi:hypothetical protein